jgi:ABC-2 type transport system permease protein
MLKKNFYTVWVFAKLEALRTFRDKVALFFTFVFPLIFLFVFGGIFGGNNSVSFNVAVLDKSDGKFSSEIITKLKEEKVLKVNVEVKDLAAAREKMSRSELDATIEIPVDFGKVGAGENGEVGIPSGQMEVLYNQNNEQAAQTLSSILNNALGGINKSLVSTTTPFTVEMKSTAEKSQRRFDYTFAGLVGFSILGLGIFGPTTAFPQMKQKGVLKRLSTTTIRVWQYFVANALSYSVVGIISVASLFVFARIFFDLNMNGDYLSLILLVILGTATLFGIGLAVGGWAKNENQAAPLAQIITFPMMFLSGTFFPRFAMPEILQKISAFLPLTPIVDGVRLIVTEGKTILEIGPQVGLLAAWIVIIYAIAFRSFRWE